MSVGDYVILAIIAVWFIVAVWFLIRQHRQGKSACGCGGGGGCAGCHGGGTKNRDRSKGVAADNAASGTVQRPGTPTANIAVWSGSATTNSMVIRNAPRRTLPMMISKGCSYQRSIS